MHSMCDSLREKEDEEHRGWIAGETGFPFLDVHDIFKTAWMDQF